MALPTTWISKTHLCFPIFIQDKHFLNNFQLVYQLLWVYSAFNHSLQIDQETQFSFNHYQVNQEKDDLNKQWLFESVSLSSLYHQLVLGLGLSVALLQTRKRQNLNVDRSGRLKVAAGWQCTLIQDRKGFYTLQGLLIFACIFFPKIIISLWEKNVYLLDSYSSPLLIPREKVYTCL